MKKIFYLLILIFLITILSSCQKNEFKKLRIISHDLSEASQKDKEIVKSVLEQGFKTDELCYTSSISDIKSYLDHNLNLDIANKVHVEYRKECFNAKAYNGVILASNYCYAIVITIGDGLGSNFWTILYPEYFGYEFDGENEITYDLYFFK